jgi:Secretion system C-terminal sorting domain
MHITTMITWPRLVMWAIVFESSFSQTDDPQRFFPSAVGNRWKWQSNLTGVTRTDEITRDSTDQNGNNFLFFNGDNIPLYKLDTLHQVYFLSKVTDSTGRLIRIDSYLQYKLDAHQGDTFLTWNNSDSVVVSSSSTTLFGVPTTILQFIHYLRYSNRPFAFHSLARDFGSIHNSVDEGAASGDEDVTGCVIAGVAFGSFTSVAEAKTPQPSAFELYQNYPNPFNPSTTFTFRTFKHSHVTVEIRDVLGQQVAILADDYLSPGRHSFTWNNTHVSSGTYFCSVQQNGLSKTIKAVLIR